jgi:signal transduction histidine kinase
MTNISVGSITLSEAGVPGGADPTRMLCHDLRQAVATIRVLASMGVGEVEATGRRLDAIVGQCDWLSAVIDEALSPAESREVVDVADLVAAAAARVSLTGQTAITIRSAGSPLAWTCEVGLGRILENLLENATHAAGQGTVEVTIEQHGQSVVIDIADDGPGFGAVAARTSLGLTIVRALALSCGAEITSEPRPSHGHRVAVTVDAWQRKEGC